MAVREILQYPDPRLRLKAKAVTDFNDTVRQAIADITETMYATDNSAGLAANQVDIQLQIIAIDLSQEKNTLQILINPEILWHSDETVYDFEACLSVPETAEKVRRWAEIKFAALDQHGERYEVECGGFLARCVQHEMDHLQGKLFIDHVSSLKRARINKRLAKLRKEKAA